MFPTPATKFLRALVDAPYVLLDTHWIKVNALPVLAVNVRLVIQQIQINVTVVYLDFISIHQTNNVQHVLQIVPPVSLEMGALLVLLDTQILPILLQLQVDINVLLVIHLAPHVLILLIIVQVVLVGINFSDGNVPHHSTLDFQSLFLLLYLLSTKIITVLFSPLPEPSKLLIQMLWPLSQSLKVQLLSKEEQDQQAHPEVFKPITNTVV